MEKLNCSGCTNLTSLPKNLPIDLKIINLYKCINLIQTAYLVDQLTYLEKRNRDNSLSKIIWPEHFERASRIEKVKSNLSDAYKVHYENDWRLKDTDPRTGSEVHFPVMYLFHIFMSESLISRGGIEKIVNFLLPISEMIKSNPTILKNLHEIASSHSEACINQPVAGMSELALVVNIFSQGDIISSLESVRALRALYIVREEVAKIIGDNKGVEAELANAMYREVYHELKADGSLTQDWYGVPDGVAYETCITSFLKKETIRDITSMVKKNALDTSLEDIASFICESHLQESWAKIVLPKEEFDKINASLVDANKKFEADEITVTDVDQVKQETLPILLKASRDLTFKAIEQEKDKLHKKRKRSDDSNEELPNNKRGKLEEHQPNTSTSSHTGKTLDTEEKMEL